MRTKWQIRKAAGIPGTLENNLLNQIIENLHKSEEIKLTPDEIYEEAMDLVVESFTFKGARDL